MTDTTESTPAVADLLARARVYVEGSHAKQTLGTPPPAGSTLRHALRAGRVTAAAMAGVSKRIIMLQTGHKNIAVLCRHIRKGSVFRENAAATVGFEPGTSEGQGGCASPWSYRPL